MTRWHRRWLVEPTVVTLVTVVSVVSVVSVLLAPGTAYGSPGGAAGGRPQGSTLTTAPGLDGLHFTNVTKASGLDSPQASRQLTTFNSMTAGVAACDFFGNGRIDFYVTRVGLPNELFRNNGNGTFTNVAAKAGVEGVDWRIGYSGATCGDLNGDGRPDLYVTSAGDTSNILYMNNGNGTFTNDTAAAGLTLNPSPGGTPNLMFGSAFGDYNHDGRLDIVTVQWDVPGGSATSPDSMGAEGGGRTGNPGDNCAGVTSMEEANQDPDDPGAAMRSSRLYRNDGNGPGGIPHFSDVTKQMGLDLDNVDGFTPTFVDLTGNGWDDLVIAGDYCTSQVFMNDDGKGFTNITQSSGAGTAQNGMGSVLADFTGDGLPDWFETSISYPGNCPTSGTIVGCTGDRMFINNGNGTFSDETTKYGVRNGGWGWGAAAADFNNSGRLSIFEVNGENWSPELSLVSPANPTAKFFDSFEHGSPRLWLNEGTTPFPEVAREVGITSSGQQKAAVPVDFMNDGKLGLFITNTSGDPVLYRNDTANSNGWVMIRLHDPHSENDFGVGAEVEVQATAGGATQTSELMDGGSFLSSDPLELHFGFGPGIKKVYEIKVLWPGEAVPQVLRQVRVDRYLTITAN